MIETKTSWLPFLVFAVPTAIGLISLAVGRFRREFHGEWALLGLLATAAISVEIVRQVVVEGYILTFWNENLYVDGLSALMEVLGSGLGLVIVLYSRSYIPRQLRDEPQAAYKLTVYYGLLLLFLGMMNWTCATNNIVMLYVSLEFTTLATVFLVAFYRRSASLEAGYKYLVLVTVGVLFSLIGLVLIYAAAAGLPLMAGKRILLFTELGRAGKMMPASVVLLANALLVAGFGTKAGLVPFHAWLPDAHAEAPAPISALLSGIVIKVGAYALARTTTVFVPAYPGIAVFMAVMCSVTMLVGILMAWAQDDVKRLLAFHSVSQMGYIAEGMGMGTYLGIYAGLFHLLNHTIFKALLFLSIGAVIYSTGGLRRMSQMGGLAAKMPITALCFFTGALAMGGMPPFNGFFSKFTLFVAVADMRLLWAAIIGMITGLLTLACMVHAAYKVFWGPLRAEAVTSPSDLKEVPLGMQVAMLVLAAMTLAIGLIPKLTYPLLDSATRCILQILGK